MTKYRNYNAEYYDVTSTDQNVDIDFYAKKVGPSTTVLELGCGSGRVAIPLSKKCQKVTGVDVSMPLLEAARDKQSGLQNIELIEGDITQANLGTRFDLVIAPYRVTQVFEKDEETRAFFETIKRHLKPSGTAILDVFNTNQSNEEMQGSWQDSAEKDCGSYELENGDILRTYEVRDRIDTKRQVIYPTLIYRRYRDDKVVDEHRNPICMRYFYPDEFLETLKEAGFKVLNTYGGYQGEEYGKGPELVVEVGI